MSVKSNFLSCWQPWNSKAAILPIIRIRTQWETRSRDWRIWRQNFAVWRLLKHRKSESFPKQSTNSDNKFCKWANLNINLMRLRDARQPSNANSPQCRAPMNFWSGKSRIWPTKLKSYSEIKPISNTSTRGYNSSSRLDKRLSNSWRHRCADVRLILGSKSKKYALRWSRLVKSSCLKNLDIVLLVAWMVIL